MSKVVIESLKSLSTEDKTDSLSSELILAESFFCPYVCHFCKKIVELKTCKRCKLVSYCSVEHQRRNWSSHRELCSAVSKVVRRFNYSNIFDNGSEAQSWSSIRSWAMCLIEDQLRRELLPIERQMFWFPASCCFCHSFKIDKSLVCKNCLCVSYCSSEHKKVHEIDHSVVCSELKLSFDLSYILGIKDLSQLNLDLNLSLKKFSLPSNMSDLIEHYVFNDGHYLHPIASEMLTCSASIIYSIFKANMFKNFQNKLTIILVGAEISGPESGVVEYIELLFHWCSDINEISLLFVGPTNNLPIDKPLMCSSCSSKTFNLSFYSQFYHDFVASPDFNSPDAIFIFNCGFHENLDSITDPWSLTIPLLYDSNFLTVFTSYCQEEAEKDFKRFLQLKPPCKQIHVIEESSKNPFRSLWPLRDWETDGVYYQNNYISIINTQEDGIS